MSHEPDHPLVIHLLSCEIQVQLLQASKVRLEPFEATRLHLGEAAVCSTISPPQGFHRCAIMAAERMARLSSSWHT